MKSVHPSTYVQLIAYSQTSFYKTYGYLGYMHLSHMQALWEITIRTDPPWAIDSHTLVYISAIAWNCFTCSSESGTRFPCHRNKYRISQPIRRTFFLKNVTSIRPAPYALMVSIISKLINTSTSIIYLYREIVKFASKSWYLASLYYGCQFWYVTILFSSNNLLKLKYFFFFSKISNKKSQCVLWAEKYGNTY
jgi:hypothetical protein